MAKRGPKQKQHNFWCPNKKCPLYGKVGCGNVVFNGTYQSKSGPVHYLICRSCGRSFTERTGTIFYDLRSSDDKVLQALAMLAKGMTLRGTAEVLHTKLDTIRYWLQLAAEQAEKVSEHLMKDFHVTKAELDELWTFVKKKSLHQRAIHLKKAKGGWGSVLPPNIGSY
jgi:transposase-like protein